MSKTRSAANAFVRPLAMFLALSAGIAFAAFNSTMNQAALQQEIATQRAAGQTLEQIAAAALAANVTAASFMTALIIGQGLTASQAIIAMLRGGFSADAVIPAALGLGAPESVVIKAALDANVGLTEDQIRTIVAAAKTDEDFTEANIIITGLTSGTGPSGGGGSLAASVSK